MTPVDFGGGMIFPNAWAYGEDPRYKVENVTCPACGEDRWSDGSPCEHCGDVPEVYEP